MANTLLLIHCDGSFADGATAKTVAPVGNAATSSAQYAPLTGNSSSGLFDGSGDYLTVANHPDFDFLSRDFTIEFWYRPSSVAVAQQLCTKRATSSNFPPWLIQLNETGKIILGASVTGAAWAAYGTSTDALVANTWYHIAAVRNGTSYKLYVDGVEKLNLTLSGALMTNTDAVLIGGDTNNYSVNGYLDEIRISEGARYTAGFVRPSAPFSNTALFGTAALIHCDGTSFVDETGKPVTVSGTPVISSAQYATLTGNTKSGLFVAGSDRLTLPASSHFDFGAGEFTIECWLRFSTAGVNHNMLSRRAGSAAKGPFALYINTTRNIQFLASFNGTTWGVSLQSPSNIAINTWYHIAITRKGNVWQMFQSGVRIAYSTVSGTLMASSEPLRIGGESNGSSLDGYLDEIRVTKGLALYDGVSYTVPTAPFAYPDPTSTVVTSTYAITTSSAAVFAPAVRETVFSASTGSAGAFAGRVPPAPKAPVLLLHMDGADGSTTFTDEMGKAVTRGGTTATISTASSAPLTGNTASALFTGAAEYLSIADHADFAFGNGEFTVEMFVRPAAISGYQSLYTKRLSHSAVGPLGIRISSVGSVTVDTSSNGWSSNLSLDSDKTRPDLRMAVGVWRHIAVTRVGGTVTLYVDGVAVDSGSIASLSLVSNTHPVRIGGDVALYHFNGRIDEVRVIKGEAKWLSGFTPPTIPYSSGDITTSFSVDTGSASAFQSPGEAKRAFDIATASGISLDSVFLNGNTAMLLHMDGANDSTTFVDECKNLVVRVGNPRISTAQGKFGSQSALFDGASRLDVHGTDATFTIGTKRFLLEAWIYPTTTSASEMQIFTVGARQIALTIKPDGKIRAEFHFIGGTKENVYLETAGSVGLNTWTHVGIGIDWYGPVLNVNGAQAASYNYTAGTIIEDTVYMNRVNMGFGFVGHIDEARFTLGFHPYYNGAPSIFTPPGVPLKIPFAPTAGAFINAGSDAAFVAPIPVPGQTLFSITTSSAADIKAVGVRAVARAFNIAGSSATSLDGWLLIGASSYFNITIGSDFWFKSPAQQQEMPAFSIIGRSTAAFASPAIPKLVPVMFYTGLTSDLVARGIDRRGGKALMWGKSDFRLNGRQNAPYTFSISASSSLSFRTNASIKAAAAVASGSLFSVKAAATARAQAAIAQGSTTSILSRRASGGKASVAAASAAAFQGSYGYLAPIASVDTDLLIFFRGGPQGGEEREFIRGGE